MSSSLIALKFPWTITTIICSQISGRETCWSPTEKLSNGSRQRFSYTRKGVVVQMAAFQQVPVKRLQNLRWVSGFVPYLFTQKKTQSWNVTIAVMSHSPVKIEVMSRAKMRQRMAIDFQLLITLAMLLLSFRPSLQGFIISYQVEMPQPIKPRNPQKQKKDQRQKNAKLPEQVLPYQIGVRVYKSFLKRHSNNPNILFRSLEHRSSMQRSQLSDHEKKKVIARLLQKSIEGHTRYSRIEDDFFISNEAKTNVYNLQFGNNEKITRRATKLRFNSTYRKLIMSGKMGSTLRLSPEGSKSKDLYEVSEGQNPEVQRVKNNMFTPRLKRLDYTKPNQEILSKYLEKFETINKEKSDKNELVLPTLTQINHLEQLQKFRFYLQQFQSQQKYKNLPKMSINSQHPHPPKPSEEKPTRIQLPRPRAAPKQSSHKDSFDRWQNKQDNDYSSLDITQMGRSGHRHRNREEQEQQ